MANDVDCSDTLFHLVNVCWQSKSIPEAWKHSTVVTLFKKGDTSLPSNYRPISLLVVAYKILAALLLDRLRSGGVESRLHQSQYGFRPKRSIGDALYLARRLIDAAVEDPNGTLYMVMLDWSKAFDRIKQHSLIIALRRFGLPEPMLQMIAAIYDHRNFCVRNAG